MQPGQAVPALPLFGLRMSRKLATSSIVEVPMPIQTKRKSKCHYSSHAVHATEIASVGAVAFTVVNKRPPECNKLRKVRCSGHRQTRCYENSFLLLKAT